MSTFRLKKVKCFMCGHESEFYMMASTSAFGSMDLDTRPPALERYANSSYVQSCPNCGYANYTVDTPTTVSEDFLQSEEYQTMANQKLPIKAIHFCQCAMLGREEKDAKKEFWNYMRAAWECDDKDDDVSARICRLCALKTLEDAKDVQIMSNEDSAAIMRADLLRRTQQFEEVINQFNKYQTDNDFLQKLIRYEIKLAKQKDSACHSIDEE